MHRVSFANGRSTPRKIRFPVYLREEHKADMEQTHIYTFQEFIDNPIEKLFRKDTFNALDEADGEYYDDRLNVRKVIDPKTGADQCRDADIRFISGTPCWLCGYKIIKNAQCDHIIPSTKAVLLAGVFPQKTVCNNKSGCIDEFRTMNFAWAHSQCNNKKSNRQSICFYKTFKISYSHLVE